MEKFASSLMGSREPPQSAAATPNSWLQRFARHLKDKSLYAGGFCSELLLTADDTLYVSLETSPDNNLSRKKAVFHHKASSIQLLYEALKFTISWLGL